MWELPEMPVDSATNDDSMTLRHSITVTDYKVRVVRGPAPGTVGGRWVRKERIPRLALTGLARKILRQAQVI